MDRGTQQLVITVVPGSGSGELAGLSGTMGIRIADGKHHYSFVQTPHITKGGLYETSGHLHWYKHEGWQDGKAGLTGPKVVGLNSSWNFYASVFAGGDGVLYAVNPDGNLRWHRHEGWQSGEESWKVLNHDPRVTRIWAVVGDWLAMPPVPLP